MRDTDILAIAKALYMNRLHLLILTEVVRHGIGPDPETGNLSLPPDEERALREQAFDFLLAVFPPEYHLKLESIREKWLTLQ